MDKYPWLTKIAKRRLRSVLASNLCTASKKAYNSWFLLANIEDSDKTGHLVLSEFSLCANVILLFLIIILAHKRFVAHPVCSSRTRTLMIIIDTCTFCP